VIFGCETHFQSELRRIHYRPTDRPRQAAYEIFTIESRFQRSKFRHSKFKRNQRTTAL